MAGRPLCQEPVIINNGWASERRTLTAATSITIIVTGHSTTYRPSHLAGKLAARNIDAPSVLRTGTDTHLKGLVVVDMDFLYSVWSMVTKKNQLRIKFIE